MTLESSQSRRPNLGAQEASLIAKDSPDDMRYEGDFTGSNRQTVEPKAFHEPAVVDNPDDLE